MAALLECDGASKQLAEEGWPNYTQHQVLARHLPPSCRAMRPIVHSDARRDIGVSPGKNRHLVAESQNLLRFFVHLPAVDNHTESEVTRDQCLLDIAARIRKKTGSQDVIVEGDFNIDLLPVHSADPAPEPNRESKHEEERAQLHAWAEGRLGLKLTPPAAYVAPHPEFEETLLAPISKINSAGNPFSLLDYTFATPGIVKESWLLWKDNQSDHAVLYNRILPRKTRPPWMSKKSKWSPADAQAVGPRLQPCHVHDVPAGAGVQRHQDSRQPARQSHVPSAQ